MCLRIDSAVMMFDGTFRKVQDLEVGNMLMGDDSTPRHVITTPVLGSSKIYKIQPKKGDPYYVNSTHVLTLCNSTKPRLMDNIKYKSYYIRWYEGLVSKNKAFNYSHEETNQDQILIAAKNFIDSLSNIDYLSIIDINVTSYLSLSSGLLNIIKGFRVPLNNFSSTKVTDKLPIDPWIFGYWLGDGTSSTSTITTADSEVIKAFQEWVEKVGDLRMSKLADKYGYRISGIRKTGGNSENKFLNALRDINVLNNKHVPDVFKTASRDARLQVLAGLIDSDGSLSCGCYDFIQKNERMFDDVIFLARSLGFAAYKAPCRKECVNNGVWGDYFRCCISGDIRQIPTKVTRKQYKQPRRKLKNCLNYGIKITIESENDQYVDFKLDGNGRFVMSDFSVTHC